MKPVLQNGPLCALAAAALFAAGCASLDTATLPPQTVFAVTRSNQLIQFHASTPDRVSGYRPLSGLQQGEQIVGIDFRPANRQLYAVGTAGQLYRIDPWTGIAEPVGESRLRRIASGDVGFDFDPVRDRIRLVTAEGENLRLHPDTGAVLDADPARSGLQTDPDLVWAPGEFTPGQSPRVTSAAHTNSMPGARETTQYAIDRAAGVLLTQGTRERAFRPVSPDGGQLFAVGELGVPLGDGPMSFDVGPDNAGYLSVAADGRTAFYRVDLRTGAAALVGTIGVDEPVTAIAIAPAGP